MFNFFKSDNIQSLLAELRTIRLSLTDKEKYKIIRDLLQRLHVQNASPDPYHANFGLLIQETNKIGNACILEIGSRNSKVKQLFTQNNKYTGFDIHHGENVDIVGDIHKLSQYFDSEYFDVVFSISVFEHLAMPWKAILEINKVTKHGGLLFIATHPTWPAHALPWDFWRFSKETFKVLLNETTGYKIVKCDEGLPCSIVPFGNEAPMVGLHEQPAFLGVSCLAQKITAPRQGLVWDVEVEDILSSIYPDGKIETGDK